MSLQFNRNLVRFSEYYGLGKTQYELNFVDIFLEADIPLFIDPLAIRQSDSDLTTELRFTIENFFDVLLDHINTGRFMEAEILLSFLHEPYEIHLGDSQQSVRGAGVGGFQSKQILEAFRSSRAVKKGLIHEVEDCALMIEGIKHDKVSDMIANIIRHYLIQYTQEQCAIYGIQTLPTASGYYWDAHKRQWDNSTESLPMPVIDGRPQKVILVPKLIVRRRPGMDHVNFYEREMLEFEQAAHLDAMTSLVWFLKKTNEPRPPTKKDLKEIVPGSKADVVAFAQEHPELIDKFKQRRLKEFKPSSNEEILILQGEVVDPLSVAKDLRERLAAIPPGREHADDYHRQVMGIIEFVFSPDLAFPHKEFKQFGDRQRIDIAYSNEAQQGFFANLTRRNIPCSKIFFECKNYTEDPKNPEIDQLNGRFTPKTCRIGFLVCRNIQDIGIFTQRCVDKQYSNENFIIGLQDTDLIKLLELRGQGDRAAMSLFLEEKLKDLLRESSS